MPFTVSSSREAHGKRKEAVSQRGPCHVAGVSPVGSEANGTPAQRRKRLLTQVAGTSLVWRIQQCHVVRWSQGTRPFRRNRSAFLDLGSGVGIPSIYVALRFDVRCIGVERCPQLVDLANQYAASAGVGHLCRFVCADVCALDALWYAEERISHVFAFDARLGAETLTEMYGTLGQVACPSLRADSGLVRLCRWEARVAAQK